MGANRKSHNQERGRLPRLTSYSNCSTTAKTGKGPVATTYTHIHTSKGKMKSLNFDPLQVVTKEPNPPAETVLEKAKETMGFHPCSTVLTSPGSGERES